MKKDNLVYIEDVLSACQKISKYCNGLSYVQFMANEMMKDAVVHNIEIIGEVSNKLDENFQAQNPKFPIRDAITMRNKLIHGYDSVDFEIVWTTIKEDIPLLISICNKLLGK